MRQDAFHTKRPQGALWRERSQLQSGIFSSIRKACMIHAIVHAADIQDRDGGVFVMATMFGMYPFLMKLYADGGYQGPLFRAERRGKNEWRG